MVESERVLEHFLALVEETSKFLQEEPNIINREL